MNALDYKVRLMQDGLPVKTIVFEDWQDATREMYRWIKGMDIRGNSVSDAIGRTATVETI